jgi:hypothetical protein
MAIGSVRQLRAKFLAAEELFVKALVLDEDNPDTVNLYSWMPADLGHLKQAVRMPATGSKKQRPSLALWRRLGLLMSSATRSKLLTGAAIYSTRPASWWPHGRRSA